MADLPNFLFVLIIASVQAAVVREESPLWNHHVVHQLPEYRAAATVTTVVTTTATGPTTITINKRFDCAKLEAPSATTVCRRKRQYWNLPLFADQHVFVSQDDIHQQYQPLKPSQVIQVLPSALPDYRNGMAIRPYQSEPQFISPFSIQSSLDKPSDQPVYRVADPLFGAFPAFSMLLSNIFSGIFRPQPTPAVLVTSTSTVYTTTATATSTTLTATYTLKGANCLPVGVVVCPGSNTAAASSTTAASTTSSSTTASSTTSSSTTASSTTPAPTTTSATTTTGSTPTSTDSTTTASSTTASTTVTSTTDSTTVTSTTGSSTVTSTTDSTTTSSTTPSG